MKMTEEILDQWTAALRSGNYKQHTGALHINNEYCCLGVLCEVLKVPSRARLLNHNLVYTYDYYGEYCDTSLPNDIAVDLNIHQDDFICYNDKYRLTFKQIALIIENTLEAVTEVQS